MVEYIYKAIDANGKKVLGFLEASGIDDLEYRLDNQGFHFVSAKKESKHFLFLQSAKLHDAS